ncbi:MAG: sulfotransferase [Fuerstiella sp.]
MLQVIGLGYPRTGTMSLKHALETLLLGPCYHMIEVFRRPDDVAFWLSALETHGKDANWEQVFEDFQSTADCPGCCFWRPLLKAYPTARFILTVRDAEGWYDSCRSTIYEAMMHPERAPDEVHRSVQQMARRLILDSMFEGRFEDRDFALRRFREHHQAVIDAVPAEQLLVFDVADGWEPLCRFLKVDVPDLPFPRSNTRAEFQSRFAVTPPVTG